MQAEIAARNELLRQCPRPDEAQWLAITPQATLDLAASFQHAVIEELLRRAAAAGEEINARALIVSGGVASNSGLRAAANAMRFPYPVLFPAPGLSTDNAAMIAAAAHAKYVRGDFSDFSLMASATLSLAG
jgi:N6-L-threonylcarbamoyladenine synthase